MTKVSALVSAYFATEYLDGRIINLYGQGKDVDLQIIVAAQKGSQEEAIASQYALTVVPTVDVPPIGEAWNLMIERAEGDYITTANSDDRYHIGGLGYMVQTLDEHPEIGLLFSQVDITDGEMIYPWKRIENDTGEIKDAYTMLKRRCVIGPFPLWRKSVHQEVGYFDETYKVAADYQMWLKMAKAGVRFYYLADSTGVYLKRSDSLEHRNPQACRMETAEIRGAL